MRSWLLWISFLGASFSCQAERIAQHHTLSPQQAHCLGFTTEQSTDNHVNIKYPALIDNRWEPVATMVEYSIDGTPLFVSKTPFNSVKTPDPAIVIGFYKPTSQSQDAEITISYRCNKSCNWPYSKTYTVKSVAALQKAENTKCPAPSSAAIK